MPITEADANGFVECFCGEHTPATATAFLLLARRHIAVARHNATDHRVA
jgi:hypothetical protein